MVRNKEFLANINSVIAQLNNELHGNGFLGSESKVKLTALMSVVRLSPTLNTNPDIIQGLANL